MPRSGWLAVGATAAALAGASFSPRIALAAAIAAVVVAAVAMTLLPAGRRGSRPYQRLQSTRSVSGPLAAGALAIAIRLATGAGAGPAASVPIPPDPGPWRATVESVGTPRDGQQLATLRLDVDGALRVAATLPRYPVIAPGDRISVAGPLRPPPEGGYGTYLERIGVVATLRSRVLDVLPAGPGDGQTLETIRRASADGLARVLPEPEAGLAAGILVGLRDRVDRELAAAFTTAGVSHVVAISGWNIAIVGALVAASMRRASRRRRSLVTIVAIVGYTAFAGASASVLRAAVMAGVVLLARESGRAGTAAAALGWAVTILLLADPGLVLDPGFQLSALATAGLIAWATPLTRRLERAGRGRLPGWVAEGLGVSLAAQAATLPIVLAAFGRLALVAPVVDLAVVPLVPPAMAAGAVALLAGGLALAGAPAIVTTLLGLPAWFLLAVMVRIVEVGAALPFASVTLDPPLALVAGASSAALIGCALVVPRRAPRRALRRVSSSLRAVTASGDQSSGRDRRAPTSRRLGGDRRNRFGALALAIVVVALTLAAANQPDGRDHLTVLDVGQGDAILIETGRGGRLLVDGGPDPDRLLVALDDRLPPWDRRLDLVVLTHPHEDHAAGLPLLFGRYRIGRLFEPGMRGPGPGYRAFRSRLAADGRRIERLAAGDRLAIDGIRLHVLWPDAAAVPREPPDTGTGINNVSIVLLGEVGGRRFLLTGDIEEGIDPLLVTRGLPRVDVLKVAHHGSRTATTEAFLEAVRPSVAIVSAGAGNTYGHPNPATLARLAGIGARVYRTDRNGSVRVTFDGPRVLVEPQVDASALAGAPTATPAASDVPAVGVSFGCPIPSRPAATALLYHRADVGARTDRIRRPPPLPRPPGVVPPALPSGRGGRGLARRPHRAPGDPARPPACRSRGAPARRRQAPARWRSCERAPPRRGLGRLAHLARISGAGTGRRGSPGDAAPRWGPPTARGGVREPGGARRRVRGQARGPAPRIDGRAIRVVAAAIPAGRRRPIPRLGVRSAAAGAAARSSAGGGRVSGGRDPPGRGPPAPLDRASDPDGRRSTSGGPMTRAGAPVDGRALQ
jgi:competence protein ComEC